jgi:hypothetical protein
MGETPNSADTAMIEAVREELRRFQSRQFDAGVLFRCAAIDVYLAGGLQGRDDPWLHRMLASNVEKLGKALSEANSSSPAANEVENRPHVRSVVIEKLDPDFAHGVDVLAGPPT